MLNLRSVRLVLPFCLLVGSAVSKDKKPLVDETSRDDLASYAASLGPSTKAFPYAFKFPDDVRLDRVFGIDVSHYQETVEWDKVAKQGVAFVFIKATQGQQFYDSRFSANWHFVGQMEAQDSSLHRGAYHFMTATDAPDLQATNFLDTVGQLGRNDLPACLDLEWDFLKHNGKFVLDRKGKRVDQWATLSSGQIVERVTAWLTIIEAATGKRPMIYTNSLWWSDRIGANTSLSKYSLWIADYTSKSLGREEPVLPEHFSWAFWQLTDQGVFREGGIKNAVDTTVYHGNVSDLQKQFGFDTTPIINPENSHSGVKDPTPTAPLTPNFVP